MGSVCVYDSTLQSWRSIKILKVTETSHYGISLQNVLIKIQKSSLRKNILVNSIYFVVLLSIFV